MSLPLQHGLHEIVVVEGADDEYHLEWHPPLAAKLEINKSAAMEALRAALPALTSADRVQWAI